MFKVLCSSFFVRVVTNHYILEFILTKVSSGRVIFHLISVKK